ncbi:MAG: hypothetical protein ACE5GA_03090 [Candidatus Zixiibacteriota bacterium]
MNIHRMAPPALFAGLCERFRNTTTFERSQMMAYKRTTRKRRVSGIKRTARRTASTRRGRVKVWTRGEISRLRKCYRNTTNGDIAKILGRSVASVRAKAGALNLKKNKNFLSICAKSAGNGGASAKPRGRRTSSRRRVSSTRRRTASRRSAPRTRRAKSRRRAYRR